MLYLILLIITVSYAYMIRDSNEISFFMILFYGIMIVMFLVGLMEVFTDWIITEVMSKLVPNALSFFPKFEWYINHLGLITIVHALTILLVSKFNFNISKKKGINAKEVEAITNSSEVV